MHTPFGLVRRRRMPLRLAVEPTTPWGFDTSWVAPAIDASAAVTSKAIDASAKKRGGGKRRKRSRSREREAESEVTDDTTESSNPPTALLVVGAFLGGMALLHVLSAPRPPAKPEAR